MSADLLRVEAPSDAQLAYIASLCREQGWEPPLAVHSKAEASTIIGAILHGQYDADYYAPAQDGDPGRFAGCDTDYDDVPF